MKNSEKLQNWFKEEQAKGLVDFKIFASENIAGANLEDVCGEILAMNEAPNVEDKEFF